MIVLRLFSLRSKAPDIIDLGDNIVLKKADFGVIAKLFRLIKYFRKQQDRGVIYEAFMGNNNIGFIQIHEESKEEINIPWLFVDHKYRGRGIATKMMRQMIKYSAESGYTRITLEVPGNSPDAYHIYEKLGFKITGKSTDKDNIWGGLTYMELKL